MHYLDYANTLAGAATYALEQWKFQKDMRIINDDFSEGVRTGKMHAYSDVLQQITGKRSEKSWEDHVAFMRPTSA